MDSPISCKAALLQALIEEPGFGWELIERVKNITKGKLNLLQGSVYPTLWGLERDKLIRRITIEQKHKINANGRPRNYYAITASGLRLAEKHKRIIYLLFK